MHGPDGAERTRFEGFNGELSAPALDGPYRVRGTFGKAGAERELRIGTARPEADGTVRFKAILRADAGASTYTLDGRLADLMGKPRIEGELSARLPIAGLWQAPPRGSLRPAGQAAAARRDQCPTKAKPRSTSEPRSAPTRRARRSPTSRCRSSRTGGPSSSPASCRPCGGMPSRWR